MMGYRAKRCLAAAALTMALSAGSASAQSASASPPACDTSALPALPAELAGWASPSPVAAAGNARGLDRASLAPGKAAMVSLLPTPSVHYPLQPEKPGGSVSHGGLLGFTITEAGTYRIALGSAAWIDVVRNGRSLPSVAHGHGPVCSGIRKMVDFDLQPGRYLLQIAGTEPLSTGVMVSAVPK